MHLLPRCEDTHVDVLYRCKIGSAVPNQPGIALAWSCCKSLNVSCQVICTKVRDGDKRIVRLKEGEPRGRHVVIVDDLVQSGGTLRECQKLLSSQVSHC